MEIKSSDVRFDGQEFWLGLDVHHKNWKVTIRTMGMEVRTMVMPPDPRKLHAHMTRNYPGGRYSSVYEAGFSGFWAHRQLVALGIANRVVHAADVPTSDKERRQKEDARDSRKLARCLENGWSVRGRTTGFTRAARGCDDEIGQMGVLAAFFGRVYWL